MVGRKVNWVLQGKEAPAIKRRQQGGSIMMWTGIHSDKLIEA